MKTLLLLLLPFISYSQSFIEYQRELGLVDRTGTNICVQGDSICINEDGIYHFYLLIDSPEDGNAAGMTLYLNDTLQYSETVWFSEYLEKEWLKELKAGDYVRCPGCYAIVAMEIPKNEQLYLEFGLNRVQISKK